MKALTPSRGEWHPGLYTLSNGERHIGVGVRGDSNKIIALYGGAFASDIEETMANAIVFSFAKRMLDALRWSNACNEPADELNANQSRAKDMEHAANRIQELLTEIDGQLQRNTITKEQQS